MKEILQEIDQQLSEIDRESLSVELIIDAVVSDVNGMDSPESMRVAARLYGNAQRIATLVQVAFILAVHRHDSSEARKLVQEMDQLRHLFGDEIAGQKETN